MGSIQFSRIFLSDAAIQMRIALSYIHLATIPQLFQICVEMRKAQIELQLNDRESYEKVMK